MRKELEKIQTLESVITNWERVVVGFSGGVDSTVVAYAANKALRNNALIVLGITETIISEDIELARSIAAKNQFNFREVEYKELNIQNYAANPVNRCYFCKQELYRQLGEIAKQENIPFLLDGANLDDLGDYRPGRIAAQEFQVKSPLIEAHMTKQDVREAALIYGLPNYDKPAAPCLSSRIPYGTMIDLQSLTMIAQAEKFIRQLGFLNVRVRHFGTTAKIEVDSWAIPQLRDFFAEVQQHLKAAGYREVLIDEEGFASGKLNREIVKNEA